MTEIHAPMIHAIRIQAIVFSPITTHHATMEIHARSMILAREGPVAEELLKTVMTRMPAQRTTVTLLQANVTIYQRHVMIVTLVRTIPAIRIPVIVYSPITTRHAMTGILARSMMPAREGPVPAGLQKTVMIRMPAQLITATLLQANATISRLPAMTEINAPMIPVIRIPEGVSLPMPAMTGKPVRMIHVTLIQENVTLWLTAMMEIHVLLIPVIRIPESVSL